MRKTKMWYKALAVHTGQIVLYNTFFQFHEVVIKALIFRNQEGEVLSISRRQGSRIVPDSISPMLHC